MFLPVRSHGRRCLLRWKRYRLVFRSGVIRGGQGDRYSLAVRTLFVRHAGDNGFVGREKKKQKFFLNIGP
jgi:hypothetical protein